MDFPQFFKDLTTAPPLGFIMHLAVVILILALPVTSWAVVPTRAIDCVNSALANSQDLKSAQLEISAARAASQSRTGAMLPTVALAVDLQSDFAKQSSAFSRTDTRALTLAMAVPLYDPLLSSTAHAAEALAGTSETALELKNQDLIFRVLQSFFTLSNHTAVLGRLQLQQKRIAEYYQNNVNRYNLGDLKVTDVHQAKARMLEKQIAITNQMRLIADEQERLTALTSVTVGTVLEKTSIKIPATLLSRKALQDAAKRRPDFRGLELERKSALAALELERSRNRPNLYLRSSLSKALPTSEVSDTATILLQLTLPIYSGGQISHAVREKALALGAADARIASKEHDLGQEVGSALIHLQNLQTTQAQYRESLRLSGLVMQGTTTEYNAGSTTALALFDTQAQLFAIESQIVANELEETLTNLDVLRLIGALTPKELSKYLETEK